MWWSSTVLLWSLWLFVFVLVSSISAGRSGHNSTGDRNQLRCGEGVNNSNNRIWNGSDASPGQYPFTVNLRYPDNPGGHICGGVIIDEWHILTARHCVDKVPYWNMEVLIGDYDQSIIDGERRILIERPILHRVEEVDENGVAVDWWNDIALIRTREPMAFFLNRANGYGSVNRICLPDGADDHLAVTSEKLAGSKALVVAGWGFIDAQGKEPARKLQQLALEFVECPPEEQYRGQICARATGDGDGEVPQNSTRPGDSGGPLFWLSSPDDGQAYLIGLVSRRWPHTEEILFTDVRLHLDWIARNIIW